MATKPRLPRGRQFFANPGPTNIPDSVLHAVAHVTIDFNDPAFIKVYE
jgi:alanine-glyoxylate transaminase/serine-glyoxylate transaminase/serine-pyruvate transaminase